MKNGILVTLLLAGIGFGTYAQDEKTVRKDRTQDENRGTR
jgi:hypothetical protein